MKSALTLSIRIALVSSVIISGNSIAKDFDVPVVNPYMDKFHWSKRADVRSIMALDPLSEEKLATCMGSSLSAGNVAQSTYEKHFDQGKSVDELLSGLSNLYELNGYTPVPKKTLEPWDPEESSVGVVKTLEMRKLDLVKNYYESYESLKVKNSDNIVVQQEMWDYCMSIPEKEFSGLQS
ncbi:hypothetical protein [Gilvimarinus agarilyticus]|uniref:hypothetical protein n=1 Tax=Gilvimarinus agarilyticus TaxID=679259 RepID=UPI0005A0625A|nr:hypothetical protein [Gilvimarinus agarilyticus]